MSMFATAPTALDSLRITQTIQIHQTGEYRDIFTILVEFLKEV